jgi:hypothetical protein
VSSSDPVGSGCRAYYERAIAETAKIHPSTAANMPAWDDLTGEQVRAWMLAFAATAEVAVRTADAFLSIGVQP